MALAAGGLVACTAPPKPDAGPASLRVNLGLVLEGSGIATGELEVPLGRLLAKGKHTVSGRLRMDGTPLDLRVTVRSFGNFSRLVCSFPKLIVEDRSAQSDWYRSLFLITHCNEASQAAQALPTEEQVAIHEAAYQLARVTGLPALRTRMARLRFVDSAGKLERREHDAFFLEHMCDLSGRLTGCPGSYLGSDDEHTLESFREVDGDALALFHLFQIMINNRDWELLGLTPLSRWVNRPISAERRGIHNVFLLLEGDQPPLPVPFDFEISSFVGVPEAVALLTDEGWEATLAKLASPYLLPDSPPLLRWMVLRLCHFRKLHSEAAVWSAVAEIRSQRERLEAVIRSASLKRDAQERALEHLEAFFAALDPAHFDPVRTIRDAALYTGPEAAHRALLCGKVPAGIPVEVMEEQGSMARVRLLQETAVQEGALRPICGHLDVEQRAHGGWISTGALSAVRVSVH